MLSEQQFLSLLLKMFEKISDFAHFVFSFKNYEKSVFGTHSNLVFFLIQKISISQKSRFVGGVNYHYFHPKNRSLYGLELKNGTRLLLQSLNSSKNSFLALQVYSISEKRCLFRKLVTRWRFITLQSLSRSPQFDIVLCVPKRIQKLLTITNSRLLLSLRFFLLLH